MTANKILFVTDLSPNENGYAAPQTTYNFIKLFSEYKYRIIINGLHHKEMKANHEWTLGQDYFLFNYFCNLKVSNRLNKLFSKVEMMLNLNFFHIKKALQKKIDLFGPDCIICITNTAYIYKAASVFKKRYPKAKIFFYIMDDYKHYDHPYVKNTADKVFAELAGWVSISEAMATLFNKRYLSLKGKPYLVVQNPVNLSTLKKKESKNHFDKVKIAYAGSVYPNHKDALIKIIDAINASNTNIELQIFTKPEFRESFKEHESVNVIYKGSLNYKDLLHILPEFDYGLVTESFLPEYANFAKSSIQTKINDYILSGCLPVVVGPDYGACVNHISDNKIGYALCENNITAMLDFLGKLSVDANYSSTLHTAQSYLLNSLTKIKKSIAEFIS